MARKLFYAWQSERPNSVCRGFIRDVLESISVALNQAGIDERTEIDSDTQGVPGTPEILPTILKKIEDDDVFIADLTMCSESGEGNDLRRSPNPNVMFEYGYALKAKTRDRIICVMNTFYGGSDPSELPFDLRHARAPFRYSLDPNSTLDERRKVFSQLSKEMLTAAKLIVENLPSKQNDVPQIVFEGPFFKPRQELTREGDFPGQENPTHFSAEDGVVYLKGRPLDTVNFSITEIIKMEHGAAGLTIAKGNSSGSFGSNKWGRISYSLYVHERERFSTDYVQYFRNGEIEMVNGSYLAIMKREKVNVINIGYVVGQIIKPMLDIAKLWLENSGIKTFVVEVGIVGIEGWRVTLDNFRKGPMIHADKVSAQKIVERETILLLADEFNSALLGEAGLP
jgi:hypothetical protein